MFEKKATMALDEFDLTERKYFTYVPWYIEGNLRGLIHLLYGVTVLIHTFTEIL